MASLLAFDAYVTDWLNLLTRWLHVIAGIVWIGSSFYFIALDNHLRPPKDERDAESGIGGETWEIHGGGFYNIKKYLVAPRVAPGDAALVQVGGVHDLAQRFRADDRPLLPERRHVSDRQERRRPLRRRGGRDQRRPAGRGLGRLRRALPSPRRSRPLVLAAVLLVLITVARGASASCSARARCISRSARCSGR